MAQVIEVPLASRLDLSQADTFRDLLLGVRDGASDLRIDASEVQRIDTPVLQVLLAAAKDQSRTAASFEIADPSDAFLEACDLVGLSEILNVRRVSHD